MARHGRVGSTWRVAGNADARRAWNVVLLAEGFTAPELPLFRDNARRIADTLLRTAPFDAFRAVINVFAVDVVSDESGADDPVECGGTGATPRTFFDARFCNARSRRLLLADDGVALDVARAAVRQTHVALVVVNSTLWGGGGGPAPTCSIAPGAENVAIHEIGHSEFGLGDEYESWIGCGIDTDRNRHGFTIFDLSEPNLTVHEERDTLVAHKWGRMVDGAIRTPTTRNTDCTQCDPQPSPVPARTIGQFEGAHYYHCDAYRPEFDCMMRNAGMPFCTVCKEVVVRRLHEIAPEVVAGEVTIKSEHSQLMLDVAGVSRDNGAHLVQWGWVGGPNQRWRIDPLGDGTSRIVSINSGKVLDVWGWSVENHAHVVQWTWHGGANQRWRIQDAGGGTVRIVSAHSGKALDVEGWSTANGGHLIQWTSHGGANQRFRIARSPR